MSKAVAVTLAVGLGAYVLGAYSGAVATAQGPIRWTVQSAWPPTSIAQDAAKLLAETIAQTSGGRLRLDLVPAGAVVPPFEIQNAVSRGVLDAGHTTPGYIIGKLKAFLPLTQGPLYGWRHCQLVNPPIQALLGVAYSPYEHSHASQPLQGSSLSRGDDQPRGLAL